MSILIVVVHLLENWKKKRINMNDEEDEYTPDEDAIERIYMANDYGIPYLVVAVMGTILTIVFLWAFL